VKPVEVCQCVLSSRIMEQAAAAAVHFTCNTDNVRGIFPSCLVGLCCPAFHICSGIRVCALLVLQLFAHISSASHIFYATRSLGLAVALALALPPPPFLSPLLSHLFMCSMKILKYLHIMSVREVTIPGKGERAVVIFVPFIEIVSPRSIPSP